MRQGRKGRKARQEGPRGGALIHPGAHQAAERRKLQVRIITTTNTTNTNAR